MKRNNKKGFTLVEIMIVVVIIGLLAAMAIPAFQKVRETSITKSIVNDGRQLGAAAQQYMMEHGVSSVAVEVDAATGEISSGTDGEEGLERWVSQIAAGTSFTSTTDGYIVEDENFTLERGASGTIEFNAEGREVAGTGGGTGDGTD